MCWRRWLLVLMVGTLTGIAVPAIGAEDDSLKADLATLEQAQIGTSDKELLEFLRRRTLSENDRDKMKILIRQLGDDSFDVREKAAGRLIALGSAAQSLLEEAAKSSDDAEIRRRSEECVRRITSGASAKIPAAAARILGNRKAEGAAEVLLGFLPSADNDAVAEDVRWALAAVAVREGKPEPALVAALSDKLPVRRAAAAEALFLADAKESLPAIRKLLQDPAPEVRLQVGLALASHKEKDAISVLIDLLGQLPSDQTSAIEEILLRLAGDKAPDVVLGSDKESQEKARRAWSTWWKEEGDKVDLALLDGPPRVLGYTLLLFLDIGRAIELGKDAKPRWQIDRLEFPLDIQLLPNRNVLVAEHRANRVAERSTKTGQIVWEHRVDSPLVAQRLANGNTFIATSTTLMEVTKAGREVFPPFAPGNGDNIMKAEKLPNGDIACILATSRFVRLDSRGKEIRSFPVNVSTSGGRIQVLANGNVIVPEHRFNRVVEYDPHGKPVWSVDVQQPVAAVRLRNGNTLVTSMSEHRAIEFDREKKEVWEYKADTRVTRAFRR
jgi:HEAT repeat protein